MFPIRDHNPSDRTPFVTWALIVVNVVVFLLYFPELSSSQARLAGFYNQWGLVPAELAQGIDGHTIVTSMFLHGGWMHLIMNMLFLYIFGDNVEDQLGHLGYLLFYLAAGAAAALAQMAADPGSTVPMVGASGAIAGVMGGYLLLFPRARVDILVFLVIFIRVFTVPAWVMLGLWFALQLTSGAASGAAQGGGVAYWAHAGGFAAGIVLLLPVWLRRGGPDYWTRTHGAPPHEEATGRYVPRPRRDPFEGGPIQSGRYERASRAAAPAQQEATSVTRIPRAGRASTPKPPPRGPWSGNS